MKLCFEFEDIFIVQKKMRLGICYLFNNLDQPLPNEAMLINMVFTHFYHLIVIQNVTL